MLESLKDTKLEYQKLSPEEMKRRGILGRLVGICADFINPTRNDRYYSEELWETVFKDPIMKERIENGVCYGELGHPLDGREETDMEKIAVCLAEVPKKGPDGKLRAVFDILNTPNGKILKSLCDYGSKLGVSSRGSGDLVENMDGSSNVTPSSYDCQGFDIVLIPAVKSARLDYVTESLDNDNNLKRSLRESLNKASIEDRKVMQETLNNLHINLNNSSQKEIVNKEFNKTNSVGNTKVLAEELRKAIVANKELEKKIATLNEQLSVCYAKEKEVNGKVEKYQASISRLVKDLNSEKLNSKHLSALNEELRESKDNLKKHKINEQFIKDDISAKNAKIRTLKENLELRETEIRNKNFEIDDLHKQLRSLEEELNKMNEDKTEIIESLNAELATTKKDFGLMLSNKDDEIRSINEQLNKNINIAKKAVDKYISSEAAKLGLDENMIRNKLPKSFSFKDIDNICEDLRMYKLNMNSLPFNINERFNKSNSSYSMKVTESKEPMFPTRDFDDEVDTQLISLTNF